MEHLIRLVDSKATFYAAALLFTVGVALWLAWARFFHEREDLKRVPHFVMALSVLVFFVGRYAHAATSGLEGVACVAGRYSLRLVCFSHDERAGMFWGVAALQTFISAVLVIAAVLVLVHLARPGKSDNRVRAANRLRRIRRADDAGLPVAGQARREGMFRLFLFASWTITLATLAWAAVSLSRVDAVRGQVAEAFASVAFERGTVETYLQDHGRLPEDNKAAALPSPADLHRHDLSEVEVVKGSLLLEFDAATADEHLGGRHVLLMAVRDGRQVHWHCATLDVDDRYLPVHCSANL
ncbi:pilin [Rhodanobacter sp. FW102-FHT14D06]|uniref:Pilin n=2 Tax=unclassified Rhodanobacter TaxID=2621553 RepID=A0AB74UV76_9GAMM